MYFCTVYLNPLPSSTLPYNTYKNDGNKEQFSEALKYFEKSLAIVTANTKDPALISRAKSMISMVRSNIHKEEAENTNIHTEEVAFAQKDLYERAAKESESSVDAVQFGVSYAKFIKRVQHRGVESARLLMKLREICQRAHGSDHKLTKLVYSKKSQSSVWMRSESTGDSYILMDYDGSFEKCMVLNKNPNALSECYESKGGGGGEFIRLPLETLSIDEVVLYNGTIVYSSPQPIECNGDLDQFMLGDMRRLQIVDDEMWKEYEQDLFDGRLKPAELNFKDLKLGDIRDWDKETECYIIHWEDESITPCAVPRDRVFVPKCICNKCIESNKQFMHSPNNQFPGKCEWHQDK